MFGSGLFCDFRCQCMVCTADYCVCLTILESMDSTIDFSTIDSARFHKTACEIAIFSQLQGINAPLNLHRRIAPVPSQD